MATLNLNGPYRLTVENVRAAIHPGTPGVFALGSEGSDNAFYVNFIGRADHDLCERLLQFVGSDRAYKFRETGSAEEAFRRECELYHLFRPHGNRIHPARAVHSDWTCPRCNFLGWRRELQ